ncbi:exonuclease SbcCD subunit D [Anaerosinus massiliensis]|uniref:exonuclease SbcCD subunit D n=1 Tax=Massilibacillus massiliensis TaxID=1806837 RepID=UPI000A71D0EF|nr:exonuclease SbcCD subunit D [Massilibacillus massiliensis]
MRFIHTSDWHLGRLFHGRHLTDDQSYILEQFHDVIKETKPDALIIAGDIYDRSVPPTEAVELLDDTLAKILLDAKVPVMMIAGNHDSPERIGFGSKLLAGQGLHVTGTLEKMLQPVVLEDDYGKVYFMPFTYAEPALVRHVFAKSNLENHDVAMEFLIRQSLKHIPENARKVAIAHTFIAGGLESESERPLSVGGTSQVRSSLFAPFHYTALGHLHNSQRAGSEKIRYSGSLLKYSFDEANQKKGLNLVELDKDGTIKIEMISLTPKHDVRVVEGYFKDILVNREVYPVSEDYVSVKLLDTMPILDVHGQLEKVYQNLLQIERPNLMVDGKLQKPNGDHRKMSETELFDSFFEQMTGEHLTEVQRKVFHEHLDALFQAEREVKA